MLYIEGLDVWGEEDVPRAIHNWKGPGAIECVTMILPNADGTARIERAPAGESRRVVQERGVDPAGWKANRVLQTEAGSEQAVDLR